MTSRDEALKLARQYADTEGLDLWNQRQLARALIQSEAENSRMRSALQQQRDQLKFHANSDGGWVAWIDEALRREESPK